MQLEDYEQALLELCFAPRASGALSEFGVYRELVRSRFVSMAKQAYRRSFAAAGAALERCFERYLAEQAPTTPLLREVIARFGEFARADAALAAEAPAVVSDLLHFERAIWRASQAADAPLDEGLREVDFDGELVLNPTLHVLSLRHEIVDREGRDTREPAPRECALLVYRRAGEDHVRWYRASVRIAAVLEQAMCSRRPFAESLQFVLEARGETCDAGMLGDFAGELALAVQRGVVLGTRDLS